MTVRASALGSSAVAAVSRFASAFGFTAAAEDKEEKKDEDDEKNKSKKAKPARLDGESDDDYAKRCEDDEKKAEQDKPENKAEDEKEKEKAAATNFAAGAQSERDRWTAVLSNKAATGKGLAACELLSNPAMASMSAEQICGILATMPASKASGIYQRMQDRDETERTAASPGGAESQAEGPKKKAAMMVAAADKFRGGN